MELTDRPLAFIDVETTGLDPTRHEVIDLAVVFGVEVLRRTGAPWTRHLRRDEPDIAVWHTRIRPERIRDAEPKALEVNGYTHDAWADAPTAEQVVDTVVELLAGSKAVLVGHNVTFDRDFIAALVRRQGRVARLGYNTVDTVTLCYEHLVPCGLEALSLDNVRRFLNIPTHGSHAALKDAIDAREVYRRLTRSTVLDRALWRLRASRRK
ncbi:MAG: 3'-5' exonuclease [Actinobacteria bacterium]|nr:3'-5' exonuclease [Actinomycetota bacterium]